MTDNEKYFIHGHIWIKSQKRYTNDQLIDLLNEKLNEMYIDCIDFKINQISSEFKR